jgi:hypothetical protein
MTSIGDHTLTPFEIAFGQGEFAKVASVCVALSSVVCEHQIPMRHKIIYSFCLVIIKCASNAGMCFHQKRFEPIM